jgi:hypothetical protein
VRMSSPPMDLGNKKRANPEGLTRRYPVLYS